MTKKDFNKLAYRLSLAEPDDSDKTHGEAWNTWQNTVQQVMQFCQESNPRFDCVRFRPACNFNYWKTHKLPI